jgi:hypothetical protein
MKVALACVLLAVVTATAPPRISLELDGAGKLPKSIYRTHDKGLKQPNGDAVKSRQVGWSSMSSVDVALSHWHF